MVSSVPGLRLLLSLFNPIANLYALHDGMKFLYEKRFLILAMTKRDILNRYSGQILGIFWVVGHPLFQMTLLVFVFSFVFKQRIPDGLGPSDNYTLYILSGLAAWLSFNPVFSAAAVAVTVNSELIKQFNFDARVLPVKEVLSVATVWAVSIGIVVLYSIIYLGLISWTFFLIPALAIIHFMTAIGFAWVISAIAVFFKDTKDVVLVISSTMIYLLPVAYLPSAVPKLFLPILYANPLSSIIWVYQDVLFFGAIVHPLAWLISILFALFSFSIGYRIFCRLRLQFGSVL